MRTVVAVLPSLADAKHVAGHLNKMGVATWNVSVVPGAEASGQDLKAVDRAKRTNHEAFARGGLRGAIFCGFIACLMMSVKGVSPFLHRSYLATLGAALPIGVLFGGFMGVFRNMALTHEEVPLYAEAVREGGVAVAAHLRDELETPAVEMLREHQARNVRAAGNAWTASGWPGARENRHVDPCDSRLTSF